MRGTITKISEKSVFVKISCREACSSCAASKACSLSSRSPRIIEIKTKQTKEYRVGQEVELEIDAVSVWLSLGFVYIFPLLLILGITGAAALFGYDETLCAVLGLSCLIPYYVFLHHLHPWLQKRIEIKIS